MGREHLEGRDNWQQEAERRGKGAEHAFGAIMRAYVIGTDYEYDSKPRDLRDIYGSQPLSSGAASHGIQPDAVVRSRSTQ